MTYFAIGLADGTVLLYRNFEQAVMSTGSLTALPKPKVIHESPAEPITGLGFREGTSEEQAEAMADLGARSGAGTSTTVAAVTGTLSETHLFIVTTNRVLLYHVAGKGSGTVPIVLDEVGCGLGCACMERKGKDIIVAREEVIYLCGIEGRGSCYAYEGNRVPLHSMTASVLTVSDD
jgi:vacuolar protein sorting-associated protein 11